MYGRDPTSITARGRSQEPDPGAGPPEPRPGRRSGPLARLLGGAADLVLPAACLACSRPVAGTGHLGLCLACRGRLVRQPHGCAACGTPLPAAATSRLPEGWVCGDCRRRPPPFHSLRACWSYEGPAVAVVQALKFRRLDYLGGHLARELRELLAGPGDAWDLVVPVPLHWRRRWMRGYNQAERIARPLAALLGLRCAEVLRRHRATRPQTGLSREERLRNPKGAFSVRRRRLRGRRILLVDDVVTTGATLGAAARALRESGAETVLAVAVARAPGAPEVGGRTGRGRVPPAPAS